MTFDITMASSHQASLSVFSRVCPASIAFSNRSTELPLASPRTFHGGSNIGRRLQIVSFLHPLRNLAPAVISLSSAVAILLSAYPSLAATTIKMGGDDGSLNFVPSSVTVSSGEKIIFLNNKGFPHNVIFQKDGVPESVEINKISRSDYMNEQGEQFVVVLTEKGNYKFFCEPHASAGMYGEIVVT